MSPTIALLEMIGVVCGYDSQVILRGLDLTLHPGEGLCFVGRNGSGKSTILRAALGLVRVFEGQVRLGGRVPPPSDQLASSGVAYIPQGRGDLPSLTVHENLTLAALVLPQPLRRAAIDAVYAQLEMLHALRGQKVGVLSGGERTLMSLGRALVIRPQILVADELSAGLSEGSREVVIRALDALRPVGALLIAEQDASFALALGLPLRILPGSSVGSSGVS